MSTSLRERSRLSLFQVLFCFLKQAQNLKMLATANFDGTFKG